MKMLTGKGDFVGDVANAGAALAGKGIKWLGSKAKDFVSNLFGFGDYRSNTMPSRNTLIGGDVPYINSGSVGRTGSLPAVIRHKEMIANIQSSNGLQVTSYPVNPGLPQTFPWMSGMASLYQRYRVRGAVVEFVSLVNSYGGANVNGPVVLSARYEVTAPPPVSIQEACNSEFAVSGNPMTNLLMAIECDPKMCPVNVLEVRTGPIPAVTSQQLFDHCIIDVLNSGQLDNTVQIGQLWISYEIELELPIDIDIANGAVLADHWQISNMTSGNIFGTTRALTATSTLGTSLSATALTFPSFVTAGYWLVVYQGCASVANTFGVVVPTYSGGCVGKQLWATSAGPDGSFFGYAPNGGVGTNSAHATIINVFASGATYTPTQSGWTNAGAFGDVWVSPMNGNMLTLSQSKRRWAKYWKAQDDAQAYLLDQIRCQVKMCMPAPSASLSLEEKHFEPEGPESFDANRELIAARQELEVLRGRSKLRDDLSDGGSLVSVRALSKPRT